ncbi:MAG: CpsD/CapB family tyrosine-protein kinase [Clostridia bacterium]|nr:CpsD/CapB family tyrosine-protein kinase [Clostridia bacterium]
MLLPWNRPQSTDEFDPKQSLVSLYNPKSAASEAYRMLRTNIHFSTVGGTVKILEVTSALPGEGKSLTAANLAITFAQAGDTVILIDADMRRPTVHKKFEMPASPGLSECIVTGNVDASIRKGPVEGLSVIAAGAIPPNPSELLHSRQMDQLLEQLKLRANLVIIDAPPVLAVADATVLASKSDGVIMVVNLAESDRNAAKRAADALRAVNATVLGAVITGIKPPRGRYRQHYSDRYYCYYDSHYGDGEPDEKESKQ